MRKSSALFLITILFVTTLTMSAKLKGKTITHKGGLKLSASNGSFVTLQDIKLNTKTGKATAGVNNSLTNSVITIKNLLVFKGGKNKIKTKGTWKNAKVTLAKSVDTYGDPAPLMAAALGLPATAVPTGLTLGKANITVKVKK